MHLKFQEADESLCYCSICIPIIQYILLLVFAGDFFFRNHTAVHQSFFLFYRNVHVRCNIIYLFHHMSPYLDDLRLGDLSNNRVICFNTYWNCYASPNHDLHQLRFGSLAKTRRKSGLWPCISLPVNLRIR